MTRWSRGRLLTCTAAAVAACACALPQRMERAEPGMSHCPEPALGGIRTALAELGGLVWFREATQRDRELAARWCATVGAPVLELEPTRTAGSWSPDQRLDVVSWNAWIGGGDVLRLLDRELGLDCAAGSQRPARPFVLLLQEVWRASPDLPVVEASPMIPWTIDPDGTGHEDLDIAEVGRRCGLALVYVPSARNGPDTGSRPAEDKGNAILSNLSLRDPIAFDLPLEGGRKVAVAATVTLPDGHSVRVVSLHLDVASTLVRTVFSGNQTRVRQAMGLADGLDAAEADGHRVDATLVGADMNTLAGNEAALKSMWRAFPESPPWDGLGTRGSVPTDHVFFRTRAGSGLTATDYTRIRERYSSDHHPRRLLLSRAVSR